MEKLVDSGVGRCSILGRERCRFKFVGIVGAQQKHEGS